MRLQFFFSHRDTLAPARRLAVQARSRSSIVCLAVLFLTSAHLTRGDTLYTIVQNGYAFTTPAEAVAIHEEWFKDPKWSWEGKVVHKVVGDNVAMALVRYQYRPKPEATPLDTWLTYVFELQDGQWRIVHDQNTALDFPAFARANGIQLN